MTRRLFLWQKDVDEQKEMVEDMKRKNEALVYNILPPNVAKHFLGPLKSDDDLYSQSYDCVGVLFASMPNFSDFYTEESVNNQGLECLRFLNEVISDYDSLLAQPRFKDIYKIKTISSTYMAASGLNMVDSNSYEDDHDDDEGGDFSGSDHGHGTGGGSEGENKRKWTHLAQLTEFALTLKETLNFINKESFNNFVLRMGMDSVGGRGRFVENQTLNKLFLLILLRPGINQGPITAGVIGARKPHYDM